MKKTILIVLAVCLLCGAAFGMMHRSDPEIVDPEVVLDWGTVYAYGDPAEENTKIEVQRIQDDNVLILPATVSPEAVSFFFDIPEDCAVSVTGSLNSAEIRSGQPVDLTALCGEGQYDLKLAAKKGSGVSEYSLKVFFVDNIGTMYLVSDDRENKGRAWVEASPDKSNKATGNMILQNADGSVVYQDALTQIKGRGNSTWLSQKKPYQIKLSTKTDLLQTGSKDNATKTWVLLANYSDASNIRNTLIYDLGLELGMAFCAENRWVNLYYDGEYRGCYLLSEKVEIGSGRVDVADLEKRNEDANEGIDIEELPIETGVTANGATYLYCAGMNAPDDVTGGYLLEMEYSARVEAEVCYFTTSRGQNVVVKSPEYASREEMDYIASLYQEWEDAVYNGGVHPETGKRYTDYVDLKSIVICYLANEITKNHDAFHSSAFFYKDKQDDRLFMGPLWDYDVTMNYNGEMRPTGFDTVKAGLAAELCKLGDFREAVRQVYLEEVAPLMTDVLFGEADAVSDMGVIRSFRYYEELLSGSMTCNSLLWPNTAQWQQEMTVLQDFLTARNAYLVSEISKWTADPAFELAESRFADVDETAWYFEDVHKAAGYGLMVGVGGDAFRPMQKAMRAHVIQTLYNLAGKPPVAFCDVYEDVKQNAEYANAVSWGIGQGILPGSPEGLFEPMKQVSREETVVYLYRYMGAPAAGDDRLSGFADADAISEYARAAMQWAVEADLLALENNSLRPTDPITRAELASLLVRFCEGFMNP